MEGKREGRSFSLQQTSWDLLFLNSLCCRPFCEIQFGFVLFFLLSIYLSIFLLEFLDGAFTEFCGETEIRKIFGALC